MFKFLDPFEKFKKCESGSNLYPQIPTQINLNIASRYRKDLASNLDTFIFFELNTTFGDHEISSITLCLVSSETVA